MRLAIALVVAASALVPLNADARNTRLEVNFASTIERGIAEGVLDGSVRFFLAGQPHPAVQQQHGEGASSKKTNAVGKSDESACEWAALSVLKAMQNQAKQRGANAVIDIVSNYDRVEFRGNGTYECRAGGLMAGVALKAKYAKIGG